MPNGGGAVAPSLDGVWQGESPRDRLGPNDDAEVPLLPTVSRLVPEAISDDKPPNAADIKDRCAPIGVPRIWLQPYPFQIIQQPGVIAFIYENRHSYRLIYLNEPLPDARTADPWFLGHSVGHWEGDALVVQTASFNNDTRLDAVLPHSDQLKVTERLKTTHRGQVLDLSLVLEDAKTFSRPWSVHLKFSRQREGSLAEYVCGIGVLDTRYTRAQQRQ